MTHTRNTAKFVHVSGDWTEHAPGTYYRCVAYLTREKAGGFSVVAAQLPGCASQGRTMTEAIRNFKEALAGVLTQYRADEVKPPWVPEPLEVPVGAVRVTVFVPL